MSKPAIIANSDQKEIERLKRKWTRVKNIGNGIITFGTTGFVGSVLSPFDVEGPVVEIATAALAVGGLIAKKIGEDHLAVIDGTVAIWSDEDKRDLKSIQDSLDESVRKRRSNKKM